MTPKFQGRRKLQDTENARHRDSYRKQSRELDEAGFRFPGELMAAYGVHAFIANTKKLKAVNIPIVLTGAFQVDLANSEIDKFHEIRGIRNGIAHGDPVAITMKEAVVMNGELRQLALKISTHIADLRSLLEVSSILLPSKASQDRRQVPTVRTLSQSADYSRGLDGPWLKKSTR
jgi:hypothetical protein